MKKIIIPFLAVAALASCQKSFVGPDAGQEPAGETVNLTVSVPTADTKLVDVSGESDVKKLQVYVFGTGGNIEKYASVEGGSVNIICTTGAKKIAALVNGRPLEVSTLTQLNDSRSSLSDNAAGNLVMFGCVAKELSADESVNIPVKRLASKIVLKSVRTDFALQQHKNMDFVVKNIYLQNVAGDCALASLSGSPALWFNKMALEADCLPVLADTGLEQKIEDGVLYDTAHSFYCYPNGTAVDVAGGEWSPRYTRLVVEATLGGTVYFYPVSIPNIESNKVYNVILTVTQTGSSDPDMSDFDVEHGFSVTVDDWAATVEISETI